MSSKALGLAPAARRRSPNVTPARMACASNACFTVAAPVQSTVFGAVGFCAAQKITAVGVAGSLIARSLIGEPVSDVFSAMMSLIGRSLIGVSLIGRSLIGRSLIGMSLIGVSLMGRSLIGVSLIGMSLIGRSLIGGSLIGGALIGGALIGGPLSGAALIGGSVIGGASSRARRTLC